MTGEFIAGAALVAFLGFLYYKVSASKKGGSGSSTGGGMIGVGTKKK